MSDIILKPTVQVDERTWSLFSIAFDTPDGKFETHLYALSFDHAEMMLAELKETGRISGQIVDVIHPGDEP
jgi:hypothetical protein